MTTRAPRHSPEDTEDRSQEGAYLDRRILGWEKHIGAAAQAIVLLVLIWTGNSLIQLREQVAVMQVKVSGLESAVSNTAGSSRPRAEAERESLRVQIALERLTDRVEKLEARR